MSKNRVVAGGCAGFCRTIADIASNESEHDSATSARAKPIPLS
jgi:hypothetical protein